MTIEKNVSDSTAVLKILGRLDTVTSPELEAAIAGCADSVQQLVLDCEELQYVSSAGLRVFLMAHKKMASKGGMKFLHVNSAIMEVLDIIGFTSIFTIE